MPVYEYVALEASGKQLRGIIDADSPLTARQKLRGSGVFPVALNEAARREPRRTAPLGRLLARVSPAELAAATRQLAVLLEAGMPLVTALDALVSQSFHPLLKRTLAQVKDSVNAGQSLAVSLAEHPRVFSPVYVNMVRAGEATGALDRVLGRLAHLAERRNALRGRLKAALAYPVFMFGVGVLVLFVLLTFIVPGIVEIFEEMRQALPWPTRLLLRLSALFTAFWWVLPAALAAAALPLRRAARTARGKKLLDELRLRLPLAGPITRRMALARFGSTLASLLHSGVALLPALDIGRSVLDHVPMAEVIERAVVEVEAGNSLAAALGQSRWFPPLAGQMIAVGERSGQLATLLERFADLQEQEAESRLMTLTALLEPVMILAMGAAVGFIVVAILLPLFEMNQFIR